MIWSGEEGWEELEREIREGMEGESSPEETGESMLTLRPLSSAQMPSSLVARKREEVDKLHMITSGLAQQK